MLSSPHSLLEALVCIYLQRLLLSCFPLISIASLACWAQARI
jgi:hypothetical protein